MEEIKVTISIDDIHPEKGWGLHGDKCMEYLEKLHEEFGCKFTLFIPSNYHERFPISLHKDWIDWLKSKPYFELAAHGHYHECERDDIGECEFAELDNEEVICDRLDLMIGEWTKVEHQPRGWRNPGWLAHPTAVKFLSQTFHYAAIHYEHNRDMDWGSCKTFFGHDGINETDIKFHNDGKTIMFQSHIAGDWNDNVWNEENYQQMRISLGYLKENYYITYSTLNQL